MANSIQERLQGWGRLTKAMILFRLAIWQLRGLWQRAFFQRVRGLIFLIGPSVKIYGRSRLAVGANFVAERGCEINGYASEGILFGNNVTVGSYAIIRPSNIYGGEMGVGLEVGDNSNIGPYAYIGCSGKITIGKNVMMSPRVGLYAENHIFDSTAKPMKEQGVKRDSIIVEDDCWLASNVIILAGVTIGKGSILAAGSVVTKDVPPYTVVAGNPARVIKHRDSQEGLDEA